LRGKTGQPLRQLRGARLDAFFANPSGDVSIIDGAA
jgi:hypothetical protein